MKKIVTRKDCDSLFALPPPVQTEVEKIVETLNYYYGENRNADVDMGGYVLVIENYDDINNLQEIFHQPIFELTPEYVDLIQDEQETFTNSLVICSSDFSISLIIPLSLTPSSFSICTEREKRS